MPTLLAFDTSGAWCAAALLTEGGVTARAEEMSRGQAERLMDLLEEVLADAGLDWADLDGIGVGIGPGNFTGTRIAVSAARGIALGRGIPAIGVSSFAAQAEGRSPCTVVLPGPRNVAHVQIFGEVPDLPYACPAESAPDGVALLPPEAMVERIARIAAAGLGRPHPRPAPLYMRPADAAPARDAGPVMLP